MSKQTYKVCFCFRRRFRLAAAEAPADIKSLFADYSENGSMSAENLQRFMVEVQKEKSATVEDAQAVINGLRELKHLNFFHHRGIHLEAFFRYLFGDINPPVDPKLGVHHDMRDPLSHYYVYTGHNSYLTGNQLSSDCSDVPIIEALQKSVRVIELDIWPNSTKDDVEVLHGRTLTTPVLLIKCFKSIKDHAFSVSEFPVVLTLEDHLTTDLQDKVAKMITETFGEMLFSPEPDGLKSFPSPESLKRRVMISTKPPKEYLESLSPTEVEKEEKELQEGNPPAVAEALGREVSDLNSRTIDVDEDEDDEDEEEGNKPKKTASAYKCLIAIHAGKGKGGLDDWLKVDLNKVRRLSLSELQLEKAAETHGKVIVRFTQQNLLRIYPKGTRIDSSNYNPLIGWMHGAQMVALNMQVLHQGYGKSLWIMHGMFRANGGCGYVKKPAILLNSDNVFDPKAVYPVKTKLKVTVYMGEGWYYDFRHTYFDTYSPPDFYARVGIAGVPTDSVMKKTKVLEDSWIPSWDEVFEFPLTVPEMALLRVEVHEYDMSDKDDFAGQTCLPVSELREGIRAVPLRTKKGDLYKNVKLLMRFE